MVVPWTVWTDSRVRTTAWVGSLLDVLGGLEVHHDDRP